MIDNISVDFLNPNGVFETMRAYNGKIFRLDAHIERLLESAKSINLKIYHSSLEIKKLVEKDLKKSKIKEAYVRLAVVPGRKPYFNLIIKEAKNYPDIFYRKGVKLLTASTKRNLVSAQNPQVKSSNFLNGILAKSETAIADIFEIIFLNKDGLVTEGTISNIFIIKNKILFTPPTYLGLLEGITRDSVISLALNKKYTLQEAPFTRHDLYNADEVFITNSSMEVMPASWADGRVIGQGRVGEITKELMKEYNKIVYGVKR